MTYFNQYVRLCLSIQYRFICFLTYYRYYIPHYAIHIKLKPSIPTHSFKPPIYSIPNTYHTCIYTANITPNTYIMIIVPNDR